MDNIKIEGINSYGLPGGHIDQGESPDCAMNRELFEECGIVSNDLRHVDFFMHNNGKIILGYVGSTKYNKLKSKQFNIEGIPIWLSKSEFEKIQIEPSYRRFVLDNWPI